MQFFAYKVGYCWLLAVVYEYICISECDGGLPLTQVYALEKLRDLSSGVGVGVGWGWGWVVQYKCTKCSFLSSKYELLQRMSDGSIQTGSEKAKSGSKMAKLRSEMAKLGSEMAKLGSEMAKLESEIAKLRS